MDEVSITSPQEPTANGRPTTAAKLNIPGAVACLYLFGFPLCVLLLLPYHFPAGFVESRGWIIAGGIICPVLAGVLGIAGLLRPRRAIAVFAIVVAALELVPGLFVLLRLATDR